MLYKEDATFLKWIVNRLIHKFADSPKEWHIYYLKDIISRIENQDIQISNEDLNKILAKYYIDFFLDKTDTCGFTEDDRTSMRVTVKNICKDIINKTISKPLIGP